MHVHSTKTSYRKIALTRLQEASLSRTKPNHALFVAVYCPVHVDSLKRLYVAYTYVSPLYPYAQKEQDNRKSNFQIFPSTCCPCLQTKHAHYKGQALLLSHLIGQDKIWTKYDLVESCGKMTKICHIFNT